MSRIAEAAEPNRYTTHCTGSCLSRGCNCMEGHYPHSPGFKEPTTSRDAALAIAPRAGRLRERVLAAIAAAGSDGLTADEAAELIGATVLAVRPRVTELYDMKEIAPILHATRKNVSGRAAKVWRKA